jgi:mycoredoxin
MMNNRHRNLFALLLVIGVPLLINQWWKINLLFDPIDTSALTNNSVMLYSTSWCPYCEKTRQFLNQANIPFTEKDIEKSPQAAAEHRALGGVGIPLIKINAQVIEGYEPNAIRRAIETPQNELNKPEPSANESLPAPSAATNDAATPASIIDAPALPLTP